MSVIISNCEEISNSPVNFSKSKQLYSFSKCDRFKYTKCQYFQWYLRLDTPFYDLPSIFGKRTTSLGYGLRDAFSVSSISFIFNLGRTPGPGTYILPTDFKNDPSKGFQFGLGRDAYAKTFVKSSPATGKEVPGPGTYPMPVFGKDVTGSSYMGFRTSNNDFTKTHSFSPGPGHYKLPTTIHPIGKIFNSKFRSSCATLFNPKSSARFKQRCMYITNCLVGNDPGPGHYPIKPSINTNGVYFLSKYRSSGCIRFLGGAREGSLKPKTSSILFIIR